MVYFASFLKNVFGSFNFRVHSPSLLIFLINIGGRSQPFGPAESPQSGLH